jgi:hypothetical protein
MEPTAVGMLGALSELSLDRPPFAKARIPSPACLNRRGDICFTANTSCQKRKGRGREQQPEHRRIYAERSDEDQRRSRNTGEHAPEGDRLQQRKTDRVWIAQNAHVGNE